MTFSGIAVSPNTFRLGSHPQKNAAPRNFEIPFGQDNRGTFSLTCMSDSLGKQSFIRVFWNPHTSQDANTNLWGFDFFSEGFESRSLQWDRNGCISLGPVGTVSASSKSTQNWAKSRSATFSALRTETSGSTFTEPAQQWANSSAVNATMRGNGFLTVKDLIITDIPEYADDASSTLSLSCTTTNGSAVVATASTTGMKVGMSVTGTGVLAGSFVASVDSSTQFTMSNISNSSGTNTLAIRLPANTLYKTSTGEVRIKLP
jgi:hypothetical protein